MNNHEEQLIVELASGTLPPEEARRLEASLSEEAREVLAAHRLVIGAIAQAEDPVMTDIERARLHRGVAAEISEITRELSASEPTPPATVMPRRARRIRWMRFASAAGAAALFIGVVAVGTQLSGGSTDSDATALSAGSSETTLTAAADQAATAEDFEERNTLDASQGIEAAEPAPSGTTMAQPRTLSLVLEVPSIGSGTEESDLEDLARAVTEATEVAPADATDLACFDEALAAVDTEPEILVKGFTLMYLDQQAVGFQSQAVDDEEAIRIFDPVTCEELATTPR